MSENFRYDAFISYRHVEPDRSIAKWLHHSLETYKVPKDLVAKGFPSKIKRVFRDEEELPASADLSSEINLALEGANFLIVICSPRIVESITVEDVKNEHLFFLKNMNLYTGMAELSYQELLKSPVDKFLKEAPKSVVIMRMLLPNVDVSCTKSYGASVRLQQAVTAIEINNWFSKNNSYPAKLSDLKLEQSLLIDPFTEKEFEYTASEKGFTLKSPGFKDSNNPDKINEIIFTTVRE